MGIYEFNQEVYDRVLREDGEAIGIEKGIKIGKCQGIEIGKESGILSAIENLMDTLKMTAEQAMTVLKVPETEWTKYMDKLKK